MKNMLIVTGLLVVGLGALLSAGLADQSPNAAAGSGPVDSRQFDGLTFPHRKALLGFGRVSGVVATRPVEVGDRVEAGQLVAELRSETEKAAIAISRLKSTGNHEVLAADMNEKQAMLEFNRVDSLFKRNLATEWEHEKAKVEYEITKLRAEYARFQRQLVDLELKRDLAAVRERELYAPWAGVISETLKEAGESVQDSMPIVELAQYDPLRVEVNLPEDFEVRLNQKARVVIDGLAAEGHVTVVQPQVTAASRTYRVRLQLPNPDQKFKAGKIARVQFLDAFAEQD